VRSAPCSRVSRSAAFYRRMPCAGNRHGGGFRRHRQDVTFLIAALGLRNYFREVLAVDEISRPKPDPEIYLKTAEKLG